VIDMSLELKDLRLKITPETDCVLRAKARASGKDLNEIARQVLDQWAVTEIHAATVLGRFLQAEGLDGAGRGTLGRGRTLDSIEAGGLDWEGVQ
jgi:hypothetical protein